MPKEKSKKSKSSDMVFPGGEWDIYIRDDVKIGSLRIDPIPEPTSTQLIYQGELKFRRSDAFKHISDRGYGAIVCIHSDIPGAISFHIPDAGQEYDPNTDPQYGFVFVGFYSKESVNDKTTIVLNGQVKVPPGFGKESGPPSDEGDTVNWTSKGHQA